MRKLLIIAAALAATVPALTATNAAPVPPLGPPPPPPPMLPDRNQAASLPPSGPGATLYRAADVAFKAGNYAEAERLLTVAADQGDAAACFKLYVYYVQGKGLKQDKAKAMAFLRRAAEAEYLAYLAGGTSVSANAMLRLAWSYEAGLDGVTPDQAEAIKWYRRSAQTGNPSAAQMLAARNIQP